jgi:predicted enzyme related to lactoylglutathione lyase
MGVEDIDAMLKVIEANGGKTLSAKEPVGDMGFAAYFTGTRRASSCRTAGSRTG